jgi:Fe2+ transport system protein FeoA
MEGRLSGARAVLEGHLGGLLREALAGRHWAATSHCLHAYVELGDGASAEAAMAWVFKHTGLESTFPVQMNALLPAGLLDEEGPDVAPGALPTCAIGCDGSSEYVRVPKAHGGRALQGRLQRLGLLGGEEVHVVHPVGSGLGGNELKLGDLRLIGGHNQFAAAPMRHRAFSAIGVQLLTPLHAQAGLERTLRVVDAGVDDLAVARTGAGAYGVGRFEYQHLSALKARRQGQRPRGGQANHAGADHHRIDMIHQRLTAGAGRA